MNAVLDLFAAWNTRVVLTGVTLLGVASGLTGTFLLLRRRALLADVLGHATLPGLCLAFIILATMGIGRNFGVLLLGASVTAVAGVLAVLALVRSSPRIKEDAALGIVLSVFFGFGVVLLGIATRIESTGSAGITTFIYGRAASMLPSDAMLIGIGAILALVVCGGFLKELTLLCFNPEFAAAQGWPVLRLDLLLMGLAVVVTVIGLQAVGLILVVALLLIPPSAARFWTHDLRAMLILSGAIGGLSGLIGTLLSASVPGLPAGAIIVLSATGLFLASATFGTASGMVPRGLDRLHTRRRVTRQNILRFLAERGAEPPHTEHDSCPVREISRRLNLGPIETFLTLRDAERRGLTTRDLSGVRLTAAGFAESRRLLRQHRLWELYLIHFADVAPTHVDRDADQVEHLLDAELVERLEALIEEGGAELPPSPH